MGGAPSWTSIREVTLEKTPKRGPNRLLLGFWRSVERKVQMVYWWNLPGLCNLIRPIICHKLWEHVVGRFRLRLESLTKIGQNNAFRLLFSHCFKICNISFTLACMIGKYFRKPGPDWGCFQLIWGRLGLFTVIFKLIQGQSGTFRLPRLLLSLLKILLHLKLFFFCLNLTWVTLTHSGRVEGCFNACFLQVS